MNTERTNKRNTTKKLAIECNNHAWSLLEKSERKASESELMVHAAHASYYHWLKAGNEVNKQRAAWLLARVYSELNISNRAVQYASECFALSQEHKEKMMSFDICYGYEAMARAHAVNGSHDEAHKHYTIAMELTEKEIDKENRDLLFSDIASGNWAEFKPTDK